MRATSTRLRPDDRLVVAHHCREDVRVDVPARQHDDGAPSATPGCARRHPRRDLARQERGDTDRARPLDDQLRLLEQQHHRLGDLVLGDRLHRVDVALDDRHGQPARALDRDAVGDRGIAGTSTGWPASHDAANGAQAAACTPTSRTAGWARLIATPSPLIRPPPPRGTTTHARSGTASSSSSPERRLARDHIEVVEGMRRTRGPARRRWPAPRPPRRRASGSRGAPWRRRRARRRPC